MGKNLNNLEVESIWTKWVWRLTAVIVVVALFFSFLKSAEMHLLGKTKLSEVHNHVDFTKKSLLSTIQSTGLRVGLDMYWQCREAGEESFMCKEKSMKILSENECKDMSDIIDTVGFLGYTKEEYTGLMILSSRQNKQD